MRADGIDGLGHPTIAPRYTSATSRSAYSAGTVRGRASAKPGAARIGSSSGSSARAHGGYSRRWLNPAGASPRGWSWNYHSERFETNGSPARFRP